ncbi:quinone oxidoreductase family protein [Luteipulveratus flavus]|uniref:Zinc-binding alcohol dehydrogenase family protein n=1 Tax=Luteipulveratus flavus TaxID=3031728 RepID=A0ABT6C252_9MICO|nr:zinc-binding alcohol dehydrogenase family protein [Luteipulveratus sp. YIM 133296]MDF8262735.1 zinc-binding alcohol dehydrogenase family protein [Luteipulveratus sp. YIM 133296]
MKQLQFTAPAPDGSATVVADVVDPTPGPGEVLIEVTHAGVNFKDVMVRRGDPEYAAAWPAVAGLEVAGVVRSVGPGAVAPPVGSRVVALTNLHGLAGLVVVPAQLVVPTPASVSDELAATVPGAWATPQLLLRRLPRDGGRVLVHSAAGGVAQAVAQLAARHGVVELVGAVGSPGRVQAAEASGYDEVHVRGQDLVERVGARRFDLVLDPLGTEHLGKDVEMTAPGGVVVLFGNAGGGASEPLPTHPELMSRNVGLAGFSVNALSAVRPDLVRAAMSEVLDAMAQGEVRGAVTVLHGLDQARVAHDALASGRAPGKYVIAL